MSCAWRDAPRTSGRSPTSGSTITGIAASTNPDSRGLVTAIMAAEPTNSIRLRSAVETETPTAALICVVSAESREISSPVIACVEERRRQAGDVIEHRDAQIGDDPLADASSRGRSASRWRRRAPPRREHDGEILVDQPDRSAEKPKSITLRTATGTASVRQRRNQQRCRRRARCGRDSGRRTAAATSTAEGALPDSAAVGALAGTMASRSPMPPPATSFIGHGLRRAGARPLDRRPSSRRRTMPRPGGGDNRRGLSGHRPLMYRSRNFSHQPIQR